MKKVKLGRTGLQVSRLGLGGLFVSKIGGELEKSRQAVKRAVELGVNYVDSGERPPARWLTSAAAASSTSC
jgi:aryl-alcohol dehydrogenase-like predicted oxidoreductase